MRDLTLRVILLLLLSCASSAGTHSLVGNYINSCKYSPNILRNSQSKQRFLSNYKPIRNVAMNSINNKQNEPRDWRTRIDLYGDPNLDRKQLYTKSKYYQVPPPPPPPTTQSFSEPYSKEVVDRMAFQLMLNIISMKSNVKMANHWDFRFIESCPVVFKIQEYHGYTMLVFDDTPLTTASTMTDGL